MNLRDVAHHPGSRVVASVAVLSNGALMHILVARRTIRFGIRKNQRRVASFARNIFMHTSQFECSRIVVEPLVFDRPIFCSMADIAVHLQRITMG